MTRLRYLFPLLISLTVCEALADTNGVASHRIIVLSPHLAELVFAIGAGERLIGVSAHTDYPEAAAALPIVGDAFMLDLERLTVLKPDMLLAWQSGTLAHVVDELQSRGYRVEVIKTMSLHDIPVAPFFSMLESLSSLYSCP